MTENQASTMLNTEEMQLKEALQHVLHNDNVQTQRTLLSAVASNMAVDVLDCAAALLHLVQYNYKQTAHLSKQAIQQSPLSCACSTVNTLDIPATVCYLAPAVKMVRYKLDIGKKHQITVKELKKVLVDESGVDKNNINNVIINNQYTLIELPDEMPQDIFQHLKTVEINKQQLNIKRLKPRNKKQANNRYRRGKQRIIQRNDSDSD